MNDIYKNIEEYNPNKKILIAFDDMVPDMLSNRKIIPTETEMFIREIKVYCYKKYQTKLKHYFIMKISNKRKFQQIAFNHLSDTDFQHFMNLY